MVLGKLPVPGRPTIWMIVGQEPIALSVGAGGGYLDIFISSILSHLFLPLSWRRPDIAEIVSQRAAKPKTSNQPTNQPPVKVKTRILRQSGPEVIKHFMFQLC